MCNPLTLPLRPYTCQDTYYISVNLPQTIACETCWTFKNFEMWSLWPEMKTLNIFSSQIHSSWEFHSLKTRISNLAHLAILHFKSALTFALLPSHHKLREWTVPNLDTESHTNGLTTDKPRLQCATHTANIHRVHSSSRKLCVVDNFKSSLQEKSAFKVSLKYQAKSNVTFVPTHKHV